MNLKDYAQYLIDCESLEKLIKDLNGTVNKTVPWLDSMPHEVLLWLIVSELLWWYVVVICVLSLPFYGYAFLKLLRSNWRNQISLLAIVVVDTFMLSSMLTSLLVAKYWKHSLGPALCKIMIFTSNVATLFTNWCWVLIWGWRYIAVFYPLRRMQFKSDTFWNVVIVLALFAAGCILESWTIFFTTEYNVGGIVFCELDNTKGRYKEFKWVILAETILTFGLPFVLIMFADIKVLCKAYSVGLFTPITRDELCKPSKNSDSCIKRTQPEFETAKIFSRKYKQKQIRRKHRSIIRCVLAGSIDIFLNLPDYTLQVMDNFISIRTMISDYRIYYGLEALAYVLYFFQFPMIFCYVRWLLNDLNTKSSPHGQSTSLPSLSIKHSPDSAHRPHSPRPWKASVDLSFSRSENDSLLITKRKRTTSSGRKEDVSGQTLTLRELLVPSSKTSLSSGATSGINSRHTTMERSALGSYDRQNNMCMV